MKEVPCYDNDGWYHHTTEVGVYLTVAEAIKALQDMNEEDFQDVTILARFGS